MNAYDRLKRGQEQKPLIKKTEKETEINFVLNGVLLLPREIQQNVQSHTRHNITRYFIITDTLRSIS